jgi:hypothetical protein
MRNPSEIEINRTVDINAMKLYAANVISTDPFFVAEALGESFEKYRGDEHARADL